MHDCWVFLGVLYYHHFHRVCRLGSSLHSALFFLHLVLSSLSVRCWPELLESAIAVGFLSFCFPAEANPGYFLPNIDFQAGSHHNTWRWTGDPVNDFWDKNWQSVKKREEESWRRHLLKRSLTFSCPKDCFRILILLLILLYSCYIIYIWLLWNCRKYFDIVSQLFLILYPFHRDPLYVTHLSVSSECINIDKCSNFKKFKPCLS